MTTNSPFEYQPADAVAVDEVVDDVIAEKLPIPPQMW
jgi:hypothetical protein